jgi:MFS family permease
MIPFLFLFNASYAIAFTPIPLLYVPEISPFSLRAKSAALLLLSQNIAQAFNQFVNPIALKAIAWKYFIVYVGVISMYLILFFLFCRETKGLTVEEAAMVYESSSRKKPAENVEVGRLGHHSSADEGLDEDYKKTELSHVEESAR